MELAIEDSQSTTASPTECYFSGHKRMKMLSEGKDHGSMPFFVGVHDESGKKKQKTCSKVSDYSDPFAIPNSLGGLDYGKYGSAAKDIAALLARRVQIQDLDLAMHKRMKMLSEGKDHGNMPFFAGSHDESGKKKQSTSSKADDYSDPFAIPNSLEGLDYGKYGSAAKDIEALLARKMRTQNLDLVMHPTHSNMFVDVEKYQCKEEYQSKELSRLSSQQANHFAHCDVIILEDDSVANDFAAVELPVVILVSDDEDSGDQRPSDSCQEVVLVKPAGQCLTKDLVVRDCAESKAPTEEEGSLAEEEESQAENEESLGGEIEVRKDKGIYIGVEDDVAIEEANHQTDIGDDGLADLWKEMAIELECSKDVGGDPSSNEHAREDGEDCDHLFVLKDDLGYVCRICGVIERGIETIFDFQYSKTLRSTRTYMSESRNPKDREPTQILPDGVKLSEDEFTRTEICVHPRHRKQMKPHQVEGFNFLLSNLVADNPGGCILAHAPGSGKTFMIISFMHSFLVQYPYARPLVVLPKGILATWKKEFQTWQVEDIPLYDFYSAKADSRSQQLDVLKQWVEHKSILFLGYKQLSSIVCDSGTCKTIAACQEILLKAPTILILDEGHTPRNENTDVLHSLAKIQTPRKVVLSGTLYQNHVKEVFNILNLVRPKFLKLDTSRIVVKRIMSRVQIAGVRKQVKANADLAFFDLVEHTLQKDDDFRRKVAVIQDLREMTSKVLHYYKGDFLDELPGLDDFTVLLNLSARQKSEVEKLKKLEMKFKRISVGSAVYMHPKLKYFSENIPEAGDKLSLVNDKKMDEMLDKLDVRDGAKTKFFLNMLNLCESTGEKLLVFSQYLLPLKFLERLAMKVKGWSPGKETFMITGDSNSELREWSMERFNSSPDAKVFFGSIKACGEGISLVGASRILILDVHLNPSVTRQAMGRAFRPGQKRKVYAYRLVAADSPEEEDHFTCYRKELISRMWFEWNEYCGHQDFQVKTVDVNQCGDSFLESPLLQEDVKVLYRR